MRIIKFRGKRIKGGDWIYGSLVKELYNYYIVELIDQTKESYTHISVEKESVGQFTGLYDKNGKEIYERDILSDKWKAEVYQNDEGTFMVKFNTNQKVNKPMSLKKYLIARENAGTSNCEGYRDCIVIGNIYENQELLKNKLAN